MPALQAELLIAECPQQKQTAADCCGWVLDEQMSACAARRRPIGQQVNGDGAAKRSNRGDGDKRGFA